MGKTLAGKLLSTGSFRSLLVVLSVVGVSACSGVEIVGSTADRVWIKSAAFSVGSTNGLAQEHCGKLGKTAELESDMSVAQGSDNILVYVCK